MIVYGVVPGIIQTTSGTPLTETNAAFIEGAGDGLRGLEYVLGLYVHGRGAGLTAISGISFRIKRGGGGSGGSIITPAPRQNGAADTNMLYYSGGVVVTTSVTLQLSIGCGAAGASGWFASSLDQCVTFESAGLSGSLAVASGLASMNYEQSMEIMH